MLIGLSTSGLESLARAILLNSSINLQRANLVSRSRPFPFFTWRLKKGKGRLRETIPTYVTNLMRNNESQRVTAVHAKDFLDKLSRNVVYSLTYCERVWHARDYSNGCPGSIWNSKLATLNEPAII